MQYAKNKNVTIFIVGHVNKEGTLAGPKILEHMVDCVLYFEGESGRAVPLSACRQKPLRLDQRDWRVRNERPRSRWRSQNPSAAMLAGHPQGASGNCIACVMEGSRPPARRGAGTRCQDRSSACRAARRQAWTTTAWCCCSPFWKSAAGLFLSATAMRIRQCRRRHETGRAGGRPAHAAGDCVELSRQAARPRAS